MSRAEEAKAESDTVGGAVKKGLSGTKKLMQEKNYRTAASMVVAEFADAQRNKHGEYRKALSRVLLAEELATLFKCQRQLGNQHAGAQIEVAILGEGNKKTGLFWEQKPALSGEALLKMVGKCTFEKTEYRAPKSSFTAERHVWLTRLNNLRIVVDGKTRSLNDGERNIALPLPYLQASDFSYKQLRKTLTNAGLAEGFRFVGLAYPSDKQKAEEKAKDPEDQRLVKLAGWQEFRRTLTDASLGDEWRKIATAALDGEPQVLDGIGWVLSVYKEDDEVERELRKLDLPNKDKVIEALLTVRFDKFSNLSLKALYKILPHMEAGLRYDEACAKAGYHHSQLHEVGAGEHKYLPPLYAGRDKDGRMMFSEDVDIPRNPVVLRALNQARKVINALIHQYGSPGQVHIEMARDLSRPFDERRDIKKSQEEFRDRNEKDRVTFNREYNTTGELKGRDFENWQLYREQQGKCGYSLEPLDINRLFELGYVEIDHALPYSRSYDDSKNNRVLVLARENRDKGNMTPYEYLGGQENSENWRRFSAFVESNKTYRQAKRNRLLKKDFGEDESKAFRDRNLNDTRYICRFFKNYVEQHLRLHEDSEAKRCVVVSGQLTAFLRARWGLIKVRGDSDRHHALDAMVVAACSHGMVRRLSDYSRRKELAQVREGFVDMETGEVVSPAMLDQLEAHFPAPWQHFRQELESRLQIDDGDRLRAAMQVFGTYSPENLNSLKPLFVSRAPQRRNSGAAHKATVYAKPRLGHKLFVMDKKSKEPRLASEQEMNSLAVERVGVMDRDMKGKYVFTADSLSAIVDAERNVRMVHALRLWLADRDSRENRAKEIESSLGRGKDKRVMSEGESVEIEKLRALPRKPCRGDPENGPFTGPVIRSLKLNAGKTSGIQIRSGLAVNDSMVRIDIFRGKKDGKYHVVPIYVHHKVAKELPNLAVAAHKDENEWTKVDDSDFIFSIYPNDFIKVTQKQGVFVGYYAGCDRGSGNVNLWAHDRSQSIGKDGLIRGIGVKTALAIEKFNVDVLGNIYPAPKEKRRGVA